MHWTRREHLRNRIARWILGGMNVAEELEEDINVELTFSPDGSYRFMVYSLFGEPPSIVEAERASGTASVVVMVLSMIEERK